MKVMETLIEREKRTANAHSIATARLAVAVYNLAGVKDKNLSPDNFLPYPSAPKEGISDKTARVFLDLLKDGLIPPHVLNACNAILSDLERVDKQ